MRFFEDAIVTRKALAQNALERGSPYLSTGTIGFDLLHLLMWGMSCEGAAHGTLPTRHDVSSQKTLAAQSEQADSEPEDARQKGHSHPIVGYGI
jgi:hypothetical protein